MLSIPPGSRSRGRGTGSGPSGQAFIARSAPGPARVQITGGEHDVIVPGAGRRGLLRAVAAGRPLLPRPRRRPRSRRAAVPASGSAGAAHRRDVLRLRLDTGPLE